MTHPASIYLNSDCEQNEGRVDNHVLDWLSLQKEDRAPAQIRRWRAARSGGVLQLALSSRQAVGINHNLLVKMIASQPDTLAGTRNKAMLSLGYDFLARRSELVALRTSDLEFTKDGALKGIIRKSKTDQYGRGRLVFGSERSAKLLRAWFRKKPKEIEAVFCAINHGVCMNRPICDRNVNEIIKKSIVKVKRCERPKAVQLQVLKFSSVFD